MNEAGVSSARGNISRARSQLSISGAHCAAIWDRPAPYTPCWLVTFSFVGTLGPSGINAAVSRHGRWVSGRPQSDRIHILRTFGVSTPSIMRPRTQPKSYLGTSPGILSTSTSPPHLMMMNMNCLSFTIIKSQRSEFLLERGGGIRKWTGGIEQHFGTVPYLHRCTHQTQTQTQTHSNWRCWRRLEIIVSKLGYTT